MKEPDQCKNMADIREAIDHIDQEIVRNIAFRAQYVKAAARFKTSEHAVKDEDRVKSVLESKRRLAQEYGIPPDLISNIYEMMIGFFINEEMDEWKKAGG